MRVNGPSNTNKAGQAGKSASKNQNGPSFTLPDVESTARVAGPAAAEPMTELDAILALQGVEDPLYARKKAIRRGNDILDELEELKADLLLGRINEGKILRLVKLLQQARKSGEPHIEAAIADIELRARVELAKLGRFPGF